MRVKDTGGKAEAKSEGLGVSAQGHPEPVELELAQACSFEEKVLATLQRDV
jgi:hypothetical protein